MGWRGACGSKPGAAARARRGGLVAASLLAAACMRAPSSDFLIPGAARVRVGPIDGAAFESAVRSAPPKLRERTDYLVDLLWQAGCLAVELPRPQVRGHDVVCSLPGRTSHRIVVLAHLDGDVDEDGAPEHWSGTALLPFLYRSLGVEQREHSFEFVAFGKAPRRRLRDYLERLDAARGQDVRAIVEIQAIGPEAIAFASSDAGLRHDFVATGLAVGRPPGSLHTFTHRRIGRPQVVPTIAIAASPPASARLPAVGASPAGVPEGYVSAARVVAVYLGYLDETLSLRARQTHELRAR